MIKEGFISKFSLLLDARNLAFGARHINLINLAQKKGDFVYATQPRWQIYLLPRRHSINLIAFKAG
ncbi:hypothetical protein [Campylobacter concisus]|uniref:hypothetical protein n=1 Tax=Campylobacter concisus TaxID=199 RepID=UPI000CD863B1|nr:hypothetical protein [Campylobacter concisus]